MVTHVVDNDTVINQICNDLWAVNRNWYAIEEYDSNSQLVYQPPPLDER